MIQVNRIYLIFNRLVTKKFLVDTSDFCLYTTRNYGKTHFYICLLATPFLHDVGAGNRAE